MPTDDWPTNLIRAYLLDALADDLRLAIEEACASEPGLFDRICALEAELIHEYLRGGLPGVERGRFAEKYLGHAPLRRRVDAEREWFEAAAASRSAEGSVSVRTVWALLRFRGLRMVVAGALILAVIGVLAYRVSALQNQLASLRSVTSRISAPRGPQVFSIILTPGRTRASGRAMRSSIPATATQIALGLSLDAGDRYASYRVAIETAEGAVVWAGTGDPAGDGVTVTVPATVLQTNDYRVRLRGIGNSDKPEDLPSYNLEVRRQ